MLTHNSRFHILRFKKSNVLSFNLLFIIGEKQSVGGCRIGEKDKTDQYPCGQKCPHGKLEAERLF
jgi:hypothetical protein